MCTFLYIKVLHFRELCNKIPKHVTSPVKDVHDKILKHAILLVKDMHYKTLKHAVLPVKDMHDTISKYVTSLVRGASKGRCFTIDGLL